MATLDRRCHPLLGTFVEISLRDGRPAIFAEAYERISQIQDCMSAHRADSDLAKIARRAHRGGVTVSKETAFVLRRSLAWARLSEGAFDPVRAAVALVHAGKRAWFADRLPDLSASWRDLEITGQHVRAARPLAVDLGGVAKGYAVDQAAKILTAYGCSGVVNAGGDIRFVGDEPREIFVKSPDSRGELIALTNIPFPTLATTGSYPHDDPAGNSDLIDPKTGAPPEAGFSITVFADNCMLADAMTKVALNLSDTESSVILKQSGCTAVLMKSGETIRGIP